MGKEKSREKGERVEINRRCWNRVSSDDFEDFSPMAEGESDGDPLGLSVCVCVPVVSSFVLVVPVVPVPFSDVNVIGEVVLSFFF